MLWGTRYLFWRIQLLWRQSLGEAIPVILRLNHAPSAGRLVILATNAAETSITVPDAGYVIDTGVLHQMMYDTATRSYELRAVRISKSQANQRAGRVGRTCEGDVFALCNISKYEAMRNVQLPSILTEDLSETVLGLVAAGEDPCTYSWLHPPTKIQILSAV
jgi:HrpA-like RNA helicase